VILIRDGRRGVQVGKGSNIRPLGGAHHDRGGAVVRKERHLLLTLAPEQVSPNLKQHPGMRAGSGYGLIVGRQWQDYPTLFRHQKTRFSCQPTSHAEPLQQGFPFICVILWDGRYGTEGRTVRHGRHGTHGTDGTARTVWHGRHGTHGTDGTARTVWHGRHGTDGTVRNGRHGTDGTDGSAIKPEPWKPSGWLRPPVGVLKPNRGGASGAAAWARDSHRKSSQALGWCTGFGPGRVPSTRWCGDRRGGIEHLKPACGTSICGRIMQHHGRRVQQCGRRGAARHAAFGEQRLAPSMQLRGTKHAERDAQNEPIE
jgi:hypothetical protein